MLILDKRDEFLKSLRVKALEYASVDKLRPVFYRITQCALGTGASELVHGEVVDGGSMNGVDSNIIPH